jgi:hypothetical protein
MSKYLPCKCEHSADDHDHGLRFAGGVCLEQCKQCTCTNYDLAMDDWRNSEIEYAAYYRFNGDVEAATQYVNAREREKGRESCVR